MSSESENIISVEQRVDGIKKWNLSYEELVNVVAVLISDNSAELEIERLTTHINSLMLALSILKLTLKKGHGAVGEALLEDLAESENAVAKALLSMQKYQKTKHATHAAMQRVKNSPKDKALKEIEVQYENTKSSFKRRGFSKQFARDMHQKYPIFDDVVTIERLVTKLNKTNEFIPKK